jgi:hypothetical protein
MCCAERKCPNQSTALGDVAGGAGFAVLAPTGPAMAFTGGKCLEDQGGCDEALRHLPVLSIVASERPESAR